MEDFARRVLALLAEPDYQPITLKAIGRKFKLDEEQYPVFRDEVKQLIRSGQIDLAKDKSLRKGSAPGMIVGTFRRSAKGFGFVRPEKSQARHEQIYIAPEASRDASSGDEVLVRVVKKARGQGINAEGRIVKIVSRAVGQFVGTYFERGDAGMVKIDGTTFTDPVYVGDPGAKGARPGDKVAIEMVRYPSPSQEGEGVITEVLGARGQPGVDTLSIVRAFGIPDAFGDDVLIDAREQAKLFQEDNVADREDLRDSLTVTIDPVTARDFDDAITLTRDEKGYYTLGVHIADVSHFVRPGTSLDREARERGTSVYLPDKVIPMLPEVISNSLASLQAGHNRYTVSAIMEFTDEGILTSKRFARSVIRVDQRFSYEQVIAVLPTPGLVPEGATPEIRELLDRMQTLAMILRRRRFARGALELDMPEVEIDLGKEGEVVGAHLVPHDESHQIIEEFMLAANEAVASFLMEQQVAFIRRGHADPEPFKLREFADFARSLGLHIENPQSRFDLQKVLKESAERPEAHAVHFGLLRSLKQATYTPEPLGHYALASEHYCHFTSPIRRYPDLQVHRQLIAVLEGRRPKTHQDELFALAEHCTRTERRAETAERELIKVKLLTYLLDKIGEVFHAVIIGVEDYGFYCRMVELPVEGLVHRSALSEDYYKEDGTHSLVARRSGRRFRLGDKLEVRIAHIDVDRRELDLGLASGPAVVPTRADRGRAASPRRGREPVGRREAEPRARPKPTKKPKPGKKPKRKRG